MRSAASGPADSPGTPAGAPAIAGRPTVSVTAEILERARGEISMLVTLLHPDSASRRARAVVREVLEAEGVPADDIADAELIADELAVNCERHSHPPYELRIFHVAGIPTWCEVVDGDPDLGWIPAVLGRPHVLAETDPLSENGRGLLLVRELSQGHCRAYTTTTFTTDTPAKAVAFALPTRSGTRLTCPPLLHLARLLR